MQNKKMLKNLEELKMFFVDKATETDLFIQKGNSYEKINRFKGIYNVTKERFSNVVSNNYKIIQHEDIVNSLYETLFNLNIKIKGKINFYGDTMDIRLIFIDNENYFVKDDKSGINLGMRILNSYDKNTSFRLEMFGFRLYCENGMVLGKALNDIKSITIHLGEDKTKQVISQIIERFVSEMINSSETLKKYINDCIKDSIEWDYAVKILNSIISIDKHRIKIFEILNQNINILGDNTKINRWDIYNALTTYITHTEQLSPNIETYLNNIAQNVLITPLENFEIV